MNRIVRSRIHHLRDGCRGGRRKKLSEKRQPDPSPTPSGSSVWREKPGETRNCRLRLWPPFFGVGPHLLNPPRKTATDGDGVRGKRPRTLPPLAGIWPQ